MICIQTFLSFKNMNENISEKLEPVIALFGVKKHIKNHKNSEKNNTMKNPSIQLLKDKIENKVNLILNKLSEMNFGNLLIEFVENINKISEADFILVQQTFYSKMQNDINFVKNYLEFFKVIALLYKDVYNYNISHFYNIINMKFLHDYNNINYEPEYAFLSEYDDEAKRINNHIIIKNMITISMLKKDIEEELNNIILEQSYHYADIYYWFQNSEITQDLENKIKNKIDKTVLPTREKVLLESLINSKQPINITSNFNNIKSSLINENMSFNSVVKSNISNNIDNDFKEVVKQKNTKKSDYTKVDTLQLEIENIIEEYLSVNMYNEIVLFIEERCKDAISKNKFCQFAFYKYFDSQQEQSKQILELLKQLVKKQSLFKSNLSRGLLLLYSKWNEIQIEYSNPSTKLKDLLIYLKNNGITKNLEHLLKANKIDFSNE